MSDEPSGEAWTSAALEAALAPVVAATRVTSSDGRARLCVVYANPAASAWGRAAGVDLVSGGALPGERSDVFLEVLATGRPLVLDAVPAGIGTQPERQIDVRARVVDDRLLLSWRDTIATTETEQALIVSEERFRLAFDEAPVGMTISELADGRARYVQVNAAYAAMLGFEPAQMIGRSGPEFTHPEDRPGDDAMLAALWAGETGPFLREKRMVRADGSSVWVRMSGAATLRDGKPRFLITHVEDIAERRAAQAELSRRALYDPLTGLANRTLLLDRLSATAAGLGDGGLLAVLYLDLDRFKDVNDSLGHAAGDDVLREVSTRITDVLRGDAWASRIAADEFVVAGPVADDLSAVRIAERLHAAIIRPIRFGHREIVVRPSIGVTTTQSAAIASETLLRRADLAMHHAKHRGSEPWALYDDDVHALAVGRLAVEEDLRTALRDGGFTLLYQPIVDLPEGRIVAAEALLRMQHPQRGLIGPSSFIDVAEDCELIVPIGEWALREATVQLARWQGHSPGTEVSVNVSPRQVRHLAVRDQVARALDESGTEASSLHLEITERVLLDANEDMLAELRDVTGDGCGLAIDDFGTGYSSLAYLTRFPVSELKIDRSFVSGLGHRDEDTAVVEAIIGLAKALDMGTVAEGVETAEQLGLLRDMGCARAQGFLLGRPVPAERISELLAL